MTLLKKTLSPLTIWGLGVGYVISGMYFGWNLGLPEGGPYGFAIATLLVTVMYVAFVLGYSELSCSMPKAGGAFIYAHRAFGTRIGLMAGMAQCIEFTFAPPAIAAAIGAYFNIFFPDVPALLIAVLAYLTFTGLNIYGVRQSAVFELVITVLAVIELLIFAGVTMPSFTWEAFSSNPLPKGWLGVLPALPYAIWFYLAIEGVANIAEETINPQRDIARGFGFAMATLVVLAVLTLMSAVGVSGWEAVVFKPGSTTPSDSPLPLALGLVVGENHVLYHLLIGIGLCGLVASFHGIILASGRAIFEMGRMGFAPRWVGTVLPSRQTPALGLLVNFAMGILALLTGRTGEIIILSVFGALTLYVISMLSLFKLRQNEPQMHRPFLTPGYPWVPALALGLSALCLAVTAAMNRGVFFVYVALLAAGYVWTSWLAPKPTPSEASV